MEFLKAQFDKLLLLMLCGVLLALYYHAMHHGADAGVLVWLQQKTGEFLASILTLCGVQAIRQRLADKPDDGGAGK